MIQVRMGAAETFKVLAQEYIKKFASFILFKLNSLKKMR